MNDHATTGSETESDVETTVRPKVSYRDIEAPEGKVFAPSLQVEDSAFAKT